MIAYQKLTNVNLVLPLLLIKLKKAQAKELCRYFLAETIPPKPVPNQSFDLAKGRIAESTNILTNSPIKTATRNNIQNTRNVSHGLSTPTSHSSNRVMSNDSFNSTLSSKTPEPFLPPSIGISTNNRKPMRNLKDLNRVTKNRASTSQIAQRLSAHMKIGAAPCVGLRGQTSNGVRSGSSFNQNINFRKG